MATDWEAELWDEEGAAGEGRQRGLIYALVAVAAVLLVAAAVVAFLVLRPAEPEPLVGIATPASTSAIEVAQTEAPQAGDTAQPTEESLVDVDVPEVGVEVPTVKPKATKKPEAAGIPSGPAQLEGLPVMVTQFLGDVPPDQLSTVISGQMGNLPPDQLQAMIGSLFPGVDPAQLPQVVAASFPDLPMGDIESLLGVAFPGVSVQLPQVGGPVGGRIALGIWNDPPDDTWGLYIVNAMGGQPVLLKEQTSEPDFSPDGQWLVYDCETADQLGLGLMKTDGTEDGPIPATSRRDSNPTFSPDGQRVLFMNYQNRTMHVINRDGTDRRDIGSGEYPAWSPAGDQIAYRGCVSGGQCGLVVANADGSNPRQITTHANDAAPRWSPNGGQIVFHSDRDGNWEVYVINSDGSWLRRITMNPTTDIMPVWSPDGLRIAFRSDRDGKGAVYVTSGVGGGATKLFDARIGDQWSNAQMSWAR
jgi:hypothetical protein